jgi:hypothetical protein
MKKVELDAQIKWAASMVLAAIDSRREELIKQAGETPYPELAAKLEQLRKTKKRIAKHLF